MTALLHSELLKVRTTRARFVYPLVIALLVGLSVAAMIGSAQDPDRATTRWQSELLDPATLAGLLAVLLGITLVTTEFRHGTITPTLLATPVRERVLAAKGIVAAALGGLFGVFALVVVAAVAVPWLLALGHDLHAGDRDVWLRAIQIVVASMLWGAIGAAVGSLVHSPIGGIVGALVWLLIAENIIVALLGLTDFEGIGDYFPGRALDSIAGNDDPALGRWTALGVALAYVAGLGALGTVRTRRRDIT